MRWPDERIGLGCNDESQTNMKTKPFNYAECVSRFIAGEPRDQIVMTAVGTPVRLIEVEATGCRYPIVGRLPTGDVDTWMRDGGRHAYGAQRCGTELVLIVRTVKREGWILLDELEHAFLCGDRMRLLGIKPGRPCLRIEWEEEG